MNGNGNGTGQCPPCRQHQQSAHCQYQCTSCWNLLSASPAPYPPNLLNPYAIPDASQAPTTYQTSQLINTEGGITQAAQNDYSLAHPSNFDASETQNNFAHFPNAPSQDNSLDFGSLDNHAASQDQVNGLDLHDFTDFGHSQGYNQGFSSAGTEPQFSSVSNFCQSSNNHCSRVLTKKTTCCRLGPICPHIRPFQNNKMATRVDRLRKPLLSYTIMTCEWRHHPRRTSSVMKGQKLRKGPRAIEVEHA